jgi:hypothetical protein
VGELKARLQSSFYRSVPWYDNYYRLDPHVSKYSSTSSYIILKESIPFHVLFVSASTPLFFINHSPPLALHLPHIPLFTSLPRGTYQRSPPPSPVAHAVREAPQTPPPDTYTFQCHRIAQANTH